MEPPVLNCSELNGIIEIESDPYITYRVFW